MTRTPSYWTAAAYRQHKPYTPHRWCCTGFHLCLWRCILHTYSCQHSVLSMLDTRYIYFHRYCGLLCSRCSRLDLQKAPCQQNMSHTASHHEKYACCRSLGTRYSWSPLHSMWVGFPLHMLSTVDHQMKTSQCTYHIVFVPCWAGNLHRIVGRAHHRRCTRTSR